MPLGGFFVKPSPKWLWYTAKVKKQILSDLQHHGGRRYTK